MNHTIEIASILSYRTKAGMVELTLNGEKTQMDLEGGGSSVSSSSTLRRSTSRVVRGP